MWVGISRPRQTVASVPKLETNQNPAATTRPIGTRASNMCQRLAPARSRRARRHLHVDRQPTGRTVVVLMSFSPSDGARNWLAGGDDDDSMPLYGMLPTDLTGVMVATLAELSGQPAGF